MAVAALRGEERIGLVAAVAIHAGLVAVLLWRPPAGEIVIPPDRIEVTLSSDVAPTSTSPEPMADARPDIAPELGEPAPPVPEAEPQEPTPQPVTKPEPRPQPRSIQRPTPRPVARPTSRPVERPRPRPSARPTSKPSSPRPASRPSAAPAAKPVERAGGSRIGSDFLEGVQGGRAAGASRNPPAQAAGPQVQASLIGALARALKPHWQGKAPEGADSEKLATILRWSLNRDGTLAGTPQVVRQEGITDANRPQAARHAEQAIRAVQLAAPFDLPDEYYDTWKRVTIRFDKRLSQ